MFLRLGVVISSSELAKEVLKIQDANFASRPYLIMGEYNFYNFRDIGFVPYGDYWKRMRKLCATELFTVKRIESFQGVRTREMRGVLPELRGKDFKHIVFEITERMLQFHISEFVLAFMRRIDWKIPEMMRIHARQDKFFKRIIDDHKARLESKTSQTMLQSLKSEGARGEDSVKAIVNKAQEEIDTVVGKERLVAERNWSTLGNRQGPAPLLIHMSTEACKVAGYDIPKETPTFVNCYTIGRDPAVWMHCDSSRKGSLGT
ncbi:cytochrome P450 750A1 [Selaginella moellendorffii]|uniref:cytochrome P450 750A1 n=1 Tax=Selaginella moellendorffii TaxID=88036 RepID=UPI000D1CE1F1|nr:cytochrome P450 750A1 [Selaginella moellendorffii]|eukprot:XP_024542660.1 cytochrome P450 750A1 [Selaginella moellendorffii]